MAVYPLQSLLSVRHYRENTAGATIVSTEQAIEEAEKLVEKQTKALEEYHLWQIEEGKHYEAVMGQSYTAEELDTFKVNLAQLTAKEVSLEEILILAQLDVKKSKEALQEAHNALKNAQKSTAKIVSHKNIWLAEENLKAARLAEIEMEEFNSINEFAAENEELW